MRRDYRFEVVRTRLFVVGIALATGLLHCAVMDTPDGGADAGTDIVERMDRTVVLADVPPLAFDAPPEFAPTPSRLTVSVVMVATGMTNFGQLNGVATTATQRVFVGNTGSYWLNGLVVAGSTMDAMPWRGAAAVPALDRPDSTWFIAINSTGTLQRLRSFTEWINVSDQFGVAGEQLLQVVSAGGSVVGFRTADSVIVTETVRSRVFTGAFTAMGGGEQKISAIVDGTVRLFTMGGMQQGWSAPGATSTSVDAMGNAVWGWSRDVRVGTMDGQSTLHFRAPMGQTVRSLTRGGARVWFLVNDELALWNGSTVAITDGLNLPAGATAVGDPSGDVWVLTSMGPRRYSAGAVVVTPQQEWEQNVQPTYARKCFGCHGPGNGQTPLDSYADWLTYRTTICSRVLRAMPRAMPPAAAPQLTAGERSTIDDWCMPPDAGVIDAGRDAARDVPTDTRG